MSTGLAYVVLSVAAYRMTRLVTTDAVFDVPRDWVQRRFPPIGRRGKDGRTKRGHPIGILTDCAWCAGVWTSGLLVGVYAIAFSLPAPLFFVLAVAGAQGLLNAIEGLISASAEK